MAAIIMTTSVNPRTRRGNPGAVRIGFSPSFTKNALRQPKMAIG